MNAADLSWDLCRSFLAVLREGNLSRAARALLLTQPTLGRHIAEIEASLGVALFTRSQQGLAPTDAAYELQPHAQAMDAAAEAFVRAASAGAAEARGTVRVTAPELLGAEILPAILTDFRARFPKVAIELAATNVTENLLQREADIAVRLVRPDQAGLFATQVGEVRFGLYAHADYLRRHPAPTTFAGLRDHTLVGFDRRAAALEALRQLPDPLVREDFAFRCDSPLAQLAAIRAGFGIGRTAAGVARRYPELTPVLPEQYGVRIGLWVVMHADARNSRRVRALFDHLAAELRARISAPAAATA